MFLWHEIRDANIPDDVEAAFEETGHFAIATEYAANFPPAKEILRDKYPDGKIKEFAHLWLREQADRNKNHENRLETVEWAILIFVALGVILDLVHLYIGR